MERNGKCAQRRQQEGHSLRICLSWGLRSLQGWSQALWHLKLKFGRPSLRMIQNHKSKISFEISFSNEKSQEVTHFVKHKKLRKITCMYLLITIYLNNTLSPIHFLAAQSLIIFWYDYSLVFFFIKTIDNSVFQNDYGNYYYYCISNFMICMYIFRRTSSCFFPVRVGDLEEFSTAGHLYLYMPHLVFAAPPLVQVQGAIRRYLCHSWTSVPAPSCHSALWAGQEGVGASWKLFLIHDLWQTTVHRSNCEPHKYISVQHPLS